MLRPVFWLSALVLLTSLLFGGGTQRTLLSNLPPQLFSLPLLAMTAPAAFRNLKQTPLLLAIVLGLFALFVLQLLPLPPEIWTRLPGRAPLADIATQAGAAIAWAPFTLRPDNAWRAGFALLPALSLLFASTVLHRREIRWLVGLALTTAAVSVAIGLLQLTSEPGGLLDFYAASRGPLRRATGFFSNPNHLATFLAVCIPLALLISARSRDFTTRLAMAGLVTLLLGGLALTGSRSVVIFGLLALGASAALIVRPASKSRKLPAALFLPIAIAVAAGVVVLLTSTGTLTRLISQSFADDARWTIGSVTLDMLRAYMPLGSGIGSFEAGYPWHESVPRLMFELVNHAHDDWLETIVEAGVFALALQLAWLFWLVGRTRALWTARRSDEGFAPAAVIGLWLICLHSFWDYPLRTIAVSALFGLLAGVARRSDPFHPDRRGDLSTRR